MKNKKQEQTETTLSWSEIDYVYTCWKQAYSDAYKDFTDYLKVAMNGKRITGTIYQ